MDILANMVNCQNISVGQQQVEELIVQLGLPYTEDTFDMFYGGDSVISWMDLESSSSL